MNVSSWLKRTAISNSIDRLDSELILARAIGQDRVFLYAHPDYELNAREEADADSMLKRRQNHEALAYILGKKEFYTREFAVSPDVLIPRPESEDIINLAKEIAPKPLKILDVGTGSGCLAVTLKLEIPEVEVLALDISPEALEIARQNAKNLNADVKFRQSDLCSALKNDEKFDLIVANLPYVDENWEWLSPELQYEPELALYARDGGLELIKRLIQQVPKHLSEQGKLILESDLLQHNELKRYTKQMAPLRLQKTSGLIQLYSLDFTD